MLIVGIDGLRPDVLREASAPAIQELARQGAYSFQALCQLETQAGEWATHSGPGWASVLTGVWANKHGIVNNRFDRASRERLDGHPDLFWYVEQASEGRLATASFTTWTPINVYERRAPRAGVDDMRRDPDLRRAARGGVRGFVVRHADRQRFRDFREGGDAAIEELAATWLREEAADLTFVLLSDVDVAGHETGYGSPAYGAAIEMTDRRVASLLAALEARPERRGEDWLVIVTSDHGGRGREHSDGTLPANRRVPLIVSGGASQRGAIQPAPVIVDVVPTALAHLGIEVREEWSLDGRPVGLAGGR
ncbi:MAG: alkaline phosphatase family protein [Proteobacteria bacterium]|nr:alkaline phosphatase family protein [Pseudomonadota bacterium]